MPRRDGVGSCGSLYFGGYGKHLINEREQFSTGIRKCDTARSPGKDFDAKLCLQLEDVLGDGGLRTLQIIGGLGEASTFCNSRYTF